MTVYLSGSLWLWALRFVALLMTLIVLFHVAVPELLLGIAWLILLVLSFVTFTGSHPPA
jgi:hypothetical protein